ncbi:MAG TPA: ribosome maturation factor RimP [Firmicutes bacterium]|nr:ribosome maturation factor RimP [Bacillota bacterium]
MPVSTVTQSVNGLIEPIVAEEGLELVDVTFTKEAGRFFLRVFIDKPGGVSTDDCERLSTRLSMLLDEHDPISQSYFLEVSSPGIDRPLKHDADFERFKGQRVRINTFAPIEGRRRLTGILLGLRDEQIQLDLGKEGSISIPRKDIAQARLAAEVNWEGIK